MQIEQIDAPEWFVERTPDAPKKLWVRGDPNLVFDPIGDRIAVVGARACTKYGADIAHSWSQALASRTFTIVSGLARGIDTEAHRGALSAGTRGGLTIAVLGCGIDQVYPRGNTALARQIVEMGGCIVSEYEPGIPPAPWRFPARNRIIAGLSRAMLVVEAQYRSGALIAAEFALECGAELYAVPGDVTAALSKATNALIRDERAKAALSPEDLTQFPGHPVSFLFDKPSDWDGSRPLQ
jgi:DNA processing protein